MTVEGCMSPGRPPTPKPGGAAKTRASGWADTMNSSSVCGFLGAGWGLVISMSSTHYFPPFPIWSASPAWGTTACCSSLLIHSYLSRIYFLFCFFKKWWYHSGACLKLHWLPITIKALPNVGLWDPVQSGPSCLSTSFCPTAPHLLYYVSAPMTF